MPQEALKKFTEDNYKGLRNWAPIFRALKAAGIKTVSPEEAYAATSTGRAPGPLDLVLGAPPVLLDVREETVHARARPLGAVNTPLYRFMGKPESAFDYLRIFVFATAFALRPPVRNDTFAAEVTALVGGNKRTPVYVICSSGGTLETAAERKIRAPRIPAPIFGQFGAASRSLLAAHELLQAGFTNIIHVEGGYSAWVSRKLPGDGDAVK